MSYILEPRIPLTNQAAVRQGRRRLQQLRMAGLGQAEPGFAFDPSRASDVQRFAAERRAAEAPRPSEEAPLGHPSFFDEWGVPIAVGAGGLLIGMSLAKALSKR